MENNTNNNHNFSWCYAFWGIFGFFFHRKNLKKLPFWKSAGVDILVWGVLIGIVSKITSMFCIQYTVLDILHTIIFMVIWGFVGAWRFNKYKKDDYDETLWKRREKYGIISGIIFGIIFYVVLFSFIAIGTHYITENAVDNRTYVYFENGYVCDKFYQVNANHIEIETNAQVEHAVKEIHTYCPSDVYRTDTVDVKTIIEVYPQLTTWDFNAHFIHTYPTENGNTAYIYLKKINR